MKPNSKILKLITASICVLPMSAMSQMGSQEMSQSTAQMTEPTSNFKWQTSALSMGMGALSYEWKVTDHFMAGPSVGYVNWRGGDVSVSGYSLGLQGTYSFDRALSDGWYLSPRIAYSPIRATARDAGVEYSGDVSGTTGALVTGYQWFWSSFNMNFGGGAIVNSVARLNLTDSSGRNLEKVSAYYTGVTPVIDFAMGYKF